MAGGGGRTDVPVPNSRTSVRKSESGASGQRVAIALPSFSTTTHQAWALRRQRLSKHSVVPLLKSTLPIHFHWAAPY